MRTQSRRAAFGQFRPIGSGLRTTASGFSWPGRLQASTAASLVGASTSAARTEPMPDAPTTHPMVQGVPARHGRPEHAHAEPDRADQGRSHTGPLRRNRRCARDGVGDDQACHRYVREERHGQPQHAAPSGPCIERQHQSRQQPSLGSGKPLPGRLACNAQRGTDDGPTHLARPKNIDDLLKLITLALQRFLNWCEPLQQTVRW